MVAALLGGCRGSDPAGRDGSGAITEAGDLPVNEARVGDCYDDRERDNRPRTLAAVPCAEPHDREVFHRFDLDGDRYPGTDVLSVDAAEICLAAFAEYVGVAYIESGLAAYPIVPSEETWQDDGDRTALCVLGREGGTLTGSQRGAGGLQSAGAATSMRD